MQGEITIIIDSVWHHSQWQGSRAQLQAEGLVPPGTEWPVEWERIEWQADSLCYSLLRSRPPGAKGPRKAFADCGWWSLLVTQPGRSFPGPIERTAAELAALVREFSPQGQAQAARIFHLYLAARSDPAWLAFCARVPALTPPKRRRHPPKARCAAPDLSQPGNIEET